MGIERGPDGIERAALPLPPLPADRPQAGGPDCSGQQEYAVGRHARDLHQRFQEGQQRWGIRTGPYEPGGSGGIHTGPSNRGGVGIKQIRGIGIQTSRWPDKSGEVEVSQII